MTMKLLMIAGEASGDAHAARLIDELRKIQPGLVIHAMGGQRMTQAGAISLLTLTDRAVVGISEVLKSVSFFRRALKQVETHIQNEKPDAVVLVDFPGFNFRVARIAFRYQVPVIYYIAPQVWAWNQGRILEMKKWLRKILVIFPFEVEIFRKAGIEAEFIGHPLIDALDAMQDPRVMRQSMGYPEKIPLIGLLPGSRENEIQHILPLLLDTSELIRARIPEARFVLPLAETLPRSMLGNRLKTMDIQVIEQPSLAHRAMVDFALTASGTATLENALLGVPMAIVYRSSWLTYQIARRLICIRNIGIVNILADKTVCQEFIQHEATPERLADYACAVLGDTDVREQIRAELLAIRNSLGEPGASRRAAEALVDALRQGK